MAAFTDYLENALLDHVLRQSAGGPAYARPASVWVGLFVLPTTDTLTSGGGNGVGQGEVTSLGGSAYARQQVTFSAPSSGQCSNTVDIVFPTAGGTGWSTVTHVAIFDNSGYGTGQALFHGQLATSKTVNNGDTFRFLAGQLVVGLS